MNPVKYRFHFEDNWQEVNGDSTQKLVEMTIAMDIRTPHACLEGGCGSCKCKLIDGEVHFSDINGILEQEEIAIGYILACQSRPITENITVDFDLD